MSLRFIYSYFGGLRRPAVEPRAGSLSRRAAGAAVGLGSQRRLAARGAAQIWRRAGPAFPEFGAGHERRLANLRGVSRRGRKKYGIGVYLYINEPRAMPTAFFKNRPEMAGVREGELTAPVHVASGGAPLDERRPGLRLPRRRPTWRASFTITASENLTNCASHGSGRNARTARIAATRKSSPKSTPRLSTAYIAAIPRPRCIVWDWGWRGHGDAPDIIARLPKSAWLMSVSEWAVPIDRGGVQDDGGRVFAFGRGPRPAGHSGTGNWPRQPALKTVAKVQLNNSWELSAVPYLPVMDLVAEHCHNLASAGVDGMMLSWSLGGYPSPNLEIAAPFRRKPTPGVDEVARRRGRRAIRARSAPLARKAWTAFSTAFRQYPFSLPVLYSSPMQVGPANPLYLEKTGYAATMTGIPYDDLKAWRGPYPAEVFAAQFEKVAQGWQLGHSRAGSSRAEGPCRSGAARRRRSCDSPGRRPFIFSRSANQRGSSPPATPLRIGPKTFRPSSGGVCWRSSWAA